MAPRTKPDTKPDTDAGEPSPEVAKVAKGIGALALARYATDTLGRPIDDKRVRSVARDVLARFDKTEHPERLTHVYTVDEAREVLSKLAGSGGASGGMTADEVRAALAPEA